MNRRQEAASQAEAPAPEVQAPAPEPQPAAAQDDKYAKLKELKELVDAGILTDEEFATEKAKILGD